MGTQRFADNCKCDNYHILSSTILKSTYSLQNNHSFQLLFRITHHFLQQPRPQMRATATHKDGVTHMVADVYINCT